MRAGRGNAAPIIRVPYYWIAVMNGTVTHNGVALDPSEGWVIYPPSSLPYIAVVATVATEFALVLAVSWLQPADDAVRVALTEATNDSP